MRTCAREDEICKELSLERKNRCAQICIAQKGTYSRPNLPEYGLAHVECTIISWGIQARMTRRTLRIFYLESDVHKFALLPSNMSRICKYLGVKIWQK